MSKKDGRIYIRVTEEEDKAIREKANQTGLTLTDFLIKSALSSTIIVQESNREELKQILRQLSGLGNNLNQLTMLCHQGRIKEVNLEETKKTLLNIYTQLINSQVRIKGE